MINAIDAGQKPGTVIRLEDAALSRLPDKSSVQEPGFADLLIALELLGNRPEEIVLPGVQPESND